MNKMRRSTKIKKHTHIKKKKTIRQTKQETPELTHIMPAPKNSIEIQQQT